ncbi:hypothetical protein A3B05_01095 [Candidatus Giovannonibacteria bacterium RIFCSPLOWO2_01_FULL_43_160]|uniref:Methyltransferase type 11 domain-containing protein n=2 Tax=Candidatus Giovannoniibacteriota TaxID=1752738 RepID=A0A0G1L543_9BACT|nr:MAG: hypothetical protein UV72_C0001G0150 [Candidatus Giovannonibacteria bacterium GW2011_GWB1_43_13]KKS99647.1 MAG: hypothetical protein UV75_C0002G0028 [Candidatus Giovannonibacteria bacterium GW2011_GWA1_43_15]KKT21489.1 MAG: hypothetical protein UW05_C0009G0023 [Candidatus Giovannonibacteria bacterium GW2011_GWC2_43_8]KKT63732.1 MAG: hypothetical protein UW55_C0001G0025 [Candidatus Giovannonibacteria bacterium GW2011_GWA2_44_26]OGF58297.1 MAG: hypothetical protein A2652_00400 [Candidatus
MDFNQYQYEDMAVRPDDPYANAKYQIIIDYLKNEKRLKILNAGCGSGELSFLLARAGHEVLGVDPAPEYIELAKRQAAASGALCKFQVSSIEDFSDSESFDCVIATDVLEHIKDGQAAANKLARFARSGGRLILTVPAMQSLFGFHDEELGHFRRYSRSQLKKLILKTRLIKIEKIRYFGFTLIPVCILFSKILRRSYPVAAFGEARTARAAVLKILLALDKNLPMPFGTSLILFGRRG